jgi:hypothetical protein
MTEPAYGIAPLSWFALLLFPNFPGTRCLLPVAWCLSQLTPSTTAAFFTCLGFTQSRAP